LQPMMASHRFVLLVLVVIMAGHSTVSAGTTTEVHGNLVIIGRGPERLCIEELAHAFEKAHFGTTVDIRWNRNFRTADLVASGDADLAVDGQERNDLAATIVAWDGLAVIVNFANPIKEVTKQQAAAVFSGAIRNWSELDERATGRVRVVLRPEDQNLSEGFEHSLGIAGTIARDAEIVRSDQKVLSRVSGQLGAVSYVSLHAAVDAATYGLSVRALIIDGIEPGTPTVQSGRYALKRPVVFLTKKRSRPITKSFVDFVLSRDGQSILGGLYTPLTQ
jgi:phosphate transport system substrate-binding protein